MTDTGLAERVERIEAHLAIRYVMAICYFDEYARVDGEWFFSRRRERHWYAADVTRTPQSAGFAGWAGSGQPELPGEFGSWASFWDGDPSTATLTTAPTREAAK